MIELTAHAMAHGGEAVARLAGKVYFVAGALPGERVLAAVDHDAGRWARAHVVEVLDPSPDRTEAPCPYFSECGGCRWQHAAYDAQLQWKRDIVTGQLRHLGGIGDPPVRPTVAPGPPYGYRNRMDFAVAGGRPALHRSRSDLLVPIDDCLLLVAPLRDLLRGLGSLDGVERITLRAGPDGHRMVVLDGSVPAQAGGWDADVVGRDGDPAGPHLTEFVDGRPLRISPTAFFQANSAGAAVLARLVREALAPRPTDTLLDAYAGGGLFGVTLAEAVARVIAVEQDGAAAADLSHNLCTTGADARPIRGSVEDIVPALEEPIDIAVCDPPRRGLGRRGVAALTAPAPRRIAYVSCDPASLSRDARLLAGAGYMPASVTPVDMFPQTFHIETVASFTRSDVAEEELPDEAAA